MEHYCFQIRVTGLLLNDGQLLIVKQRVNKDRGWSLPGGRVEAGETLEQALRREIKEETGLNVTADSLLYVSDKPDAVPPVLHITFLLRLTGGKITLPTNEFDHNPISDVKFVPVCELPAYGFTQKFVALIKTGFPGAGGYMGLKENIGL